MPSGRRKPEPSVKKGGGWTRPLWSECSMVYGIYLAGREFSSRGKVKPMFQVRAVRIWLCWGVLGVCCAGTGAAQQTKHPGEACCASSKPEPKNAMEHSARGLSPTDLFAGISLAGSTVRPDNGANENVYGKKIDAKDIVFKGAVRVPSSAEPLVAYLNKKSPKNLSDPDSLK